MQRSKAIALLALGLSVIALGLAVYNSWGPARQPLSTVLTNEESQLRDQLKLQGRGLDQPVTVRSYGSSSSEVVINDVARRLEAEGFRIVTHFCTDDGPWGAKDTWTLFADLETIPSPENLCALRERAKRLIESTGARYEGWGPPSQP